MKIGAPLGAGVFVQLKMLQVLTTTTIPLNTIWSFVKLCSYNAAINPCVIILNLCWVEPGRWRGLVTQRAALHNRREGGIVPQLSYLCSAGQFELFS